MNLPFNLAGIQKLINGVRERVDGDAVKAAHYIGQLATNHARDTGNYKDRTGNLRNSTGYAVAANGQIENVLHDRGHPAAQKKADEFAESIESDPSHVKMIGYAGMEYGVFVEAKGYDVISQSAAKLPELIEQALGKVRK